ncbi:hypothetical protein L596_029824 [Steinernema carpocapsae]|nr:hypothetical protein L596_029824 [Steinernema carpocapsae]
MKNTISGKNRIKFYGYSGHDTTVSALLRVFEAKDNIVGRRFPDYASTVAVELWDSETKGASRYQVKVRYSDNAKAAFRTVTPWVSGCPDEDFCPLEVFEKRSQEFLVKDINERCRVQ